MYKKLIAKAKKPLFIIGQGPLCSPESEEIFNYLLSLHNSLVKDASWNGFSILQNYSGRVGALDLEFYNKKNTKRNNIKDIYNGNYKVLYLFDADEIDFSKIPKDTFVIYHGHHGDKAVSRADVIIPMPCFTEKEGIYVNLEGRAQISRQIKMPLSNVEHTWEFFNKLLTEIGIESEYNSLQDIRNLMFNQYPNLMKINECISEKIFKVKAVKRSFSKNDILSNISNFYMTDSVSRNSPTMSSCSLEINNNT